MNTRILKAVFPIAGLGSRFLPATKASAKEMLPVVDKPLIQYAVEEAYEAGIRHMVFVTGRTKRSVEDHFDTAYELENELEQAGKTELLKIARGISPEDMVCSYVRQPRALGLGHAVLCAEHLVGQEPFAVLLADDLMVGQPSITAQMVQQFATLQASILAVQDVPLDQTNRYGIVSGTTLDAQLTQLSGIVEKPAPADALSDLVNVGVYCFSAAIFAEIPVEGASDFGSEILPRLVAEGADVRAWVTDAYWSDIGSLDELVIANCAVAAGAVEVDASGDLIMGSETSLVGVSQGATITGPVLVGAGARIEEGATIVGPAVIGARATICTGAHVEQALVLPEATITADSPCTGILGDPTLLDGVWSR